MHIRVVLLVGDCLHVISIQAGERYIIATLNRSPSGESEDVLIGHGAFLTPIISFSPPPRRSICKAEQLKHWRHLIVLSIERHSLVQSVNLECLQI